MADGGAGMTNDRQGWRRKKLDRLGRRRKKPDWQGQRNPIRILCYLDEHVSRAFHSIVS
jgi:hypothetical protein